MQKDLDFLYAHQKEVGLLGQIDALLGWDQQTYMPGEGIRSRSEQSSLLSQLIHRKTVSEDVYRSLLGLQQQNLSRRDGLVVKKLFKDVTRMRKLPESFVTELARTTILAHEAWEKAREKKDFALFQPHLEKIFELKRTECDYVREPGHPYNSLLDVYEEGMTVEVLRPLFRTLKNDLARLLARITSSDLYRAQTRVLLKKKFPVSKQRALCDDVIARIGLSSASSRLDLSAHPFTTTIGTPDVRITTNFRDNPLFAFMSTVHEAGHALYELQLPMEEAHTILGHVPSLGIHESQSRFWENMIGRGKAFWEFYYPRFQKTFGLHGTFDQLYREVNFVQPSFIRVEADEVTYCLHVLLRFEIELGLVEGSLTVKEVPQVWNSFMQEMLGIVPGHDGEGCLQDVHWSGGAVGYFPTYIIGTVYAAQIHRQLMKEQRDIEAQIRKGDFSLIRRWLEEKVHRFGSTMLADEIITQICKEGLNPGRFVEYLSQKYSGLYQLK